jgi:hypothetical protein
VGGTECKEERAGDAARLPIEKAAQKTHQQNRAQGEDEGDPRGAALHRRGAGVGAVQQARGRGQREVEEGRPDRDRPVGEVRERVEHDRLREMGGRESRAPQVVVVVGGDRAHARAGGELLPGLEAEKAPQRKRHGEPREEEDSPPLHRETIIAATPAPAAGCSESLNAQPAAVAYHGRQR